VLVICFRQLVTAIMCREVSKNKSLKLCDKLTQIVAYPEHKCCQVLKHMATGNVVLVPDKGSPLSSLDQLYSQALIVQESFFPKVIQLAGQHRGVFPLKGSANGFGQCDKPWDPKSLARFRFGGIKSIGRCVDTSAKCLWFYMRLYTFNPVQMC